MFTLSQSRTAARGAAVVSAFLIVRGFDVCAANEVLMYVLLMMH